ncbi:E6 [Bettongia penicillata papillomavirus 1]|uniref:Protein E6 n=1 Tax=Bettongia penicillata papillomavirus 1 TaxID=759701 RepID=D6N1B8_9PAPI|nr:E6 [Bettongia penicillata papillomavirus 1]ADG21984.1 E6 [Bettongia penicillata papillomavirus 1]
MEPTEDTLALPRSLRELGNLLGLNPYEIPITCIFCKNELTELDKYDFERKNFNLHWTGFCCKAICIDCCLAAAKEDFIFHFEERADVFNLYDRGFSLLFLDSCCVLCLKQLDLSERLSHTWCQLPLYCVRGQWRGYCDFCKDGLETK